MDDRAPIDEKPRFEKRRTPFVLWIARGLSRLKYRFPGGVVATQIEDAIEPDPSDPKRKEVNPLLKLALELGPLMVFFFANARGEWLVEKFPALGDFGGPIFVATGLFMIATAVALTASWKSVV